MSKLASTKGMATGNDSSSKEAERFEYLDSKTPNVTALEYAASDEEKQGDQEGTAPRTARDLVTEVLAVEDDPTVNPWTFRMWFIGLSMSVFAG